MAIYEHHAMKANVYVLLQKHAMEIAYPRGYQGIGQEHARNRAPR